MILFLFILTVLGKRDFEDFFSEDGLNGKEVVNFSRKNSGFLEIAVINFTS